MPSGIARIAVTAMTKAEPRIAARAPARSGSTWLVYRVRSSTSRRVAAVDEGVHEEHEQAEHGERHGPPEGDQEDDRSRAPLAVARGAKRSFDRLSDPGHQ